MESRIPTPEIDASPRELTSSRRARHSFLSWATSLSCTPVFPTIAASTSTVLLQVPKGLHQRGVLPRWQNTWPPCSWIRKPCINLRVPPPLLRVPRGLHSKAYFLIVVYCFPERIYPSHLHSLARISKSISLCPVSFNDCSLNMPLGQNTFKVRRLRELGAVRYYVDPSSKFH